MMNRRNFVTAGVAFGLAGGGLRGAEAGGKKLRVCVIGHTGRGDYGHELDTMWLGIPGCEVVGVADPVAAGLEKARVRLGGVAGFSDYREMLLKLKPDIVSVAPRWVDQHAEMVIAAAGAGVRGIYVEKPFSHTLAEADAMLEACENSGTKLAVAHRMRTHPVLPVVKKLIEDGLVGKVLEMRGRGKEDHRGGAQDLWVLGSHFFNLMNYFAGRAVESDAAVMVGGRPVTDADMKEGPEGIALLAGDEIHARFRMENGWTAYFDSAKEAGDADAGFGLEIIGNKGVLNLRVDREPFAFFGRGNPFDVGQKSTEWQPVGTAGVGAEEPIADLGKKVGSHFLAGMDLVEAIRENREPICNGEQGRMAMEMICGAVASHFAGGKISLPMSDRNGAGG